MTVRNRILAVVALLVLLPLGACSSANERARAIETGMAYDERVASTFVTHDLMHTASVVESVLRSLNISIDEREDEPDDNEIEFDGIDGNARVEIDIERFNDTGQTRIDVMVRREVNFDRARAQEILHAITTALEQGG